MSNAPTPPPLPPHPLDYGSEPYLGLPPARPIFSIGRFILATAVMLVLLGIFLFIVPRLDVVYSDFGTELPAVTVVMLKIGRLMNTPGGWVFGILIAASVGVLFAVLPIRGRGVRLLIVLLLAMIVLALALAVLLPIMNLIESISANPGKL